MEWTRQIDAYCERLTPTFWAEPVNALTNAAFVLAALLLWFRAGRAEPTEDGTAAAGLLCGWLALIGIGSFLFHSFATVWAAIADVTPILGFVLTYIFLINRDVWGMRPLWAAASTALFVPYAALTQPLFQQVPGLGSSAAYAPVALLIALYALALWQRRPPVARGLALGAALLVLSIIFRSLDLPLCGHIPIGTHFLWHILNAIMLGWMIEVYLRAVQGTRAGG